MSQERTERLQSFVAWSRQHITGDEKGQAQIFGQPGNNKTRPTVPRYRPETQRSENISHLPSTPGPEASQTIAPGVSPGSKAKTPASPGGATQPAAALEAYGFFPAEDLLALNLGRVS